MSDTEIQTLESRWDIVAATATAMARGGASLRNVPGLLKRLIREGSWREYVTPVGEVEIFATFAAFIVHPWGLNTTLDMLERICGDDMEALTMIDHATARKKGRPEKEESILSEQETNHHNIMIKGQHDAQGTSRAYALRRLRIHRPDIHARVLAGELSPHRGMIEAGFLRQPTPVETMRRAWEKASEDERVQFFRELPDSQRDLLLRELAAIEMRMT